MVRDNEALQRSDNVALKDMEESKPKYKKRWGDRVDGRLLRSLDPITQLIPYLMPTRSGSQNLFNFSIPTTELDSYVHRIREERNLPGFGIMHVLIAAYVRAISQRPGINRFVSANRLYARHGIEVIMAVKKELKLEAPETMIKFFFNPDATIFDVYNQMTDKITQFQNSPSEEDIVVSLGRLFLRIPQIFLTMTFAFVRWLDTHGWLPRILTKESPFHGSVLFTAIGSLGVPVIYHHLYDLGNVPVFVAFSTNRRERKLLSDNVIGQTRYLDCNFTLDDRICDGFYYASALREIKKHLKNPHLLEVPPQEIVEDIY